jgi:hypothetical protein
LEEIRFILEARKEENVNDDENLGLTMTIYRSWIPHGFMKRGQGMGFNLCESKRH